METEHERGLSQLAELVGGGISSLNFKITLSDGMELDVADCAMRCTRTLHEWVFEGHSRHVRITWTFTRAGSGWMVHLRAKGGSMPRIASLSSLIRVGDLSRHKSDSLRIERTCQRSPFLARWMTLEM